MIPPRKTYNSRWELEITKITLQLADDLRAICVQKCVRGGLPWFIRSFRTNYKFATMSINYFARFRPPSACAQCQWQHFRETSSMYSMYVYDPTRCYQSSNGGNFKINGCGVIFSARVTLEDRPELSIKFDFYLPTSKNCDFRNQLPKSIKTSFDGLV
jgi:hypothetical protein